MSLVEGEGDDHDGGALAGDGPQLRDPLDGVHRLLEGDPDLRLHLLGRRARQRGPHHDRGQVHGREAVDPELAVAHRPHHDQGQDDHGGEDGTADADLGQLLH